MLFITALNARSVNYQATKINERLSHMKDTDTGSTVSIISDCRRGDMSLIPGEGFF
jgi:hypothetical protein